MPNRVIHFEIQADDVTRAKDFYEKVMGWKIEKYDFGDNKNPDPMDYWMLMTGENDKPGINGGLYKRQDDNKLKTYDCTIMVDDIDAVADKIKTNGGKILREKQKMEGLGWFARAEDTEGNIFALMQAIEWKP